MGIVALAEMLALATAFAPSPVLTDKPAATARRTFTVDDGTSGTSPAGTSVRGREETMMRLPTGILSLPAAAAGWSKTGDQGWPARPARRWTGRRD